MHQRNHASFSPSQGQKARQHRSRGRCLILNIWYKCGEGTFCHRPQTSVACSIKAVTMSEINTVKTVFYEEKDCIYELNEGVGLEDVKGYSREHRNTPSLRSGPVVAANGQGLR